MTTASALRTRSREERDEINERARIRSRPLTGPQIAALKLLGDYPLEVTRAGWWGNGASIDSVSTQTLVSLENRGLVIFVRRGGSRQRVARLTPKGREQLRRCT